MTGILVSATTGVMNSLLGKLATLMGQEFAKLKNLRKEVKFIRDELTGMKDALEGLSYLDELDPQTKRWRDIVREMSYDIEDIIDDFMQNIGESNKTTGFISNTIERLRTLRARHKIAGEIKDIKKLVLETSARRERYKLDVPPTSNVAIDPRVTTLYENAANLIGVEAPADELVNLLDDEDKQLKMLSIVGFGGLGKTTLANMVYGRIKGKFNQCAFVPVSQKPDIPKLLRNLLSQLGGKISSHDSELKVLDKLREHLKNHRYLIVIDDLWDVQEWGVIKCAFPENNLGSRVIVTTRIQDVAKACCLHGSSHILKMKPLSNEDSRRLFFGRIFGSEEACPRQLRDISVEILKRCGGLPLAINSISSMLASEGSNQKERWDHVRDSLGSATNLTLERMRQILNLSYIDLPPHLKTCFLYLGMYPEDYKIDRSNLERQWMAEGFISKKYGQDVEKVAVSCFNELVNRSLIQPVDFDQRGFVTACRVHDMMLDLILIKSAEDNLFSIVDDAQSLTSLDYKARRLSIRLDGTSNGLEMLRNISMSGVRSVLLFGSSLYIPPLSKFKFLRVLFIASAGANVDLTGLCKLYQLRYLCISQSSSYKLPTELRMLQHLETIDLVRCDSLPSDIVHLPCLMFLSAPVRLPNDICNLKSLRYLYIYKFSVDTLDNIKGLQKLTNLRYLYVSSFNYLDDKGKRMDALCTSLGRLCSLEELNVDRVGYTDNLLPLSPPPTPYCLKRLLLSRFCPFSRVPTWMAQLRNIEELSCHVDELLNHSVDILAELPVLSHLDVVIQQATNETIVIYGSGAFPALKRFQLRLSSPSYLTFLSAAMPKLQKLQLKFNAHGWKENGPAPVGVEHLLALEELTAEIGCADAQESEKTSAVSSLRSAVNLHPSEPHVGIYLSNYDFFFAKD